MHRGCRPCCAWKHKHNSKAAAMEHRQQFHSRSHKKRDHNKDGRKVEVYLCRGCGYWYVGHEVRSNNYG